MLCIVHAGAGLAGLKVPCLFAWPLKRFWSAAVLSRVGLAALIDFVRVEESIRKYGKAASA